MKIRNYEIVLLMSQRKSAKKLGISHLAFMVQDNHTFHSIEVKFSFEPQAGAIQDGRTESNDPCYRRILRQPCPRRCAGG